MTYTQRVFQAAAAKLSTTTAGPASSASSRATVFIPAPFHPRSEVYAETRFGRVVRPGQDGWDRARCLAECDAVLLRIGPMPGSDIALAPKLKIIARNGTGYDAIDLSACRDRGIVVTNMQGGNASAVAELTIALALAVLRRVAELDRRIRSGQVIPSIQALAPGLTHRTVGLVGMGDIAYETAKLFQAFNCPIIVYSPTSPLTRWVESASEAGRYPVPVPHTRVDSLDDLLALSDVVSLHCPLTPSTKGLISAEQLQKMRPGAVLINTARGGMVDEKALAVALKQGVIAGAGLDVFDIEPPTTHSLGELAHLDNVVILPHVGGSTDMAQYEGCNGAIDNVADYLDGKAIRNRVA